MERSGSSVSRAQLSAVIIAIAILVAATAGTVTRAGFSPDEEITAAAVRGISATGLPRLPSGLLYLRGVPYSYAAWLAGAALGQTLAAYRWASVLCAAIAIVLFFRLAREVTRASGPAFAVLLVAGCPLFIAAAVFARFYSAFLATALGAMWLFYRARRNGSSDAGFVVLLVVSRLLHEFGDALLLVPIAHFLCLSASNGSERRQLAKTILRGGAALAATEGALILTGHFALGGVASPLSLQLLAVPRLYVIRLATPATLALMILVVVLLSVTAWKATRLSWPWLAAFAACALFFQIGACLALVVAAVLVRPGQARRLGAAAVIIGAGSTAAWIGHTAAMTSAQLSSDLAFSLINAASRYPWDGLAELSRALPFVAGAGIAGFLALTARAASGSDNEQLRSFALFGLLTILALGMTAPELPWRYLILAAPVFLMLAADGMDAARRAIPRPAVGSLLGLLLIGVVFFNQYVAAGDVSSFVPPTESRWRPDEFARLVGVDDVVVCNDELACLHLTGRVDYWLLPSADAVRKFTRVRDGVRYGSYAGAQVVSDEDTLTRLIECANRPVSILTLDLDKFDSRTTSDIAMTMARRFGGTVNAAGGEHAIVRIPNRYSMHCDRGAQ